MDLLGSMNANKTLLKKKHHSLRATNLSTYPPTESKISLHFFNSPKFPASQSHHGPSQPPWVRAFPMAPLAASIISEKSEPCRCDGEALSNLSFTLVGGVQEGDFRCCVGRMQTVNKHTPSGVQKKKVYVERHDQKLFSFKQKHSVSLEGEKSDSIYPHDNKPCHLKKGSCKFPKRINLPTITIHFQKICYLEPQ